MQPTQAVPQYQPQVGDLTNQMAGIGLGAGAVQQKPVVLTVPDTEEARIAVEALKAAAAWVYANGQIDPANSKDGAKLVRVFYGGKTVFIGQDKISKELLAVNKRMIQEKPTYNAEALQVAKDLKVSIFSAAREHYGTMAKFMVSSSDDMLEAAKLVLAATLTVPSQHQNRTYELLMMSYCK